MMPLTEALGIVNGWGFTTIRSEGVRNFPGARVLITKRHLEVMPEFVTLLVLDDAVVASSYLPNGTSSPVRLPLRDVPLEWLLQHAESQR